MSIERIFDDETFKVLKKALDASALRQKVIAQNIANVDTPGYKRADVTFEDELKRALQKTARVEMTTTHEAHIPTPPKDLSSVKARIMREVDTFMRNDENNVDPDREMTALAKNNIAFRTLAELIDRKFQGLRDVIREGRG